MRKSKCNGKRRTPIPGLSEHISAFTGRKLRKTQSCDFLCALADRLMAISIPKSTVSEVEPSHWYHPKGEPALEDLACCSDDPDECCLGWGCVSMCIVDCDSGAPLCDGWDYKPKVLASKERP